LESAASEEVLLAQRRKDRELRKTWGDLRLSKPDQEIAPALEREPLSDAQTARNHVHARSPAREHVIYGEF
jgi:hypothetical protein